MSLFDRVVAEGKRPGRGGEKRLADMLAFKMMQAATGFLAKDYPDLVRGDDARIAITDGPYARDLLGRAAKKMAQAAYRPTR